MLRPQRRSAIKARLALALLFIASSAGAESIGTVSHLDGILVATRADGTVKVLGVDSAIEQGDILSSRKQTYAALTLVDNSSVTLGPDTDLKIERYVFHKHVPDNDGALLALANGTVRITTGILGTRGEEPFTLATPTATMDIRGASLIAEYVASDQAKLASRETSPPASRQSNMVAVRYSPGAEPGFARTVSDSSTPRLAQIPRPPLSGGLAPGLHVSVLDGLIHLTNSGGSQTFAAGQFGFTPSFKQPPVVLPANPGLKFTPPPTFSSTSTNSGSKSSAVDCVVR